MNRLVCLNLFLSPEVPQGWKFSSALFSLNVKKKKRKTFLINIDFCILLFLKPISVTIHLTIFYFSRRKF